MANTPTELVDRSYSAYIANAGALFRNTTNAVGGSFILSLHRECRSVFPESHQRGWWIVHTPYIAMPERCSGIPPTQLVDRSYSAYIANAGAFFRNPTNAVGGSFILSLHRECRSVVPEYHQRSWWIVHTQPTRRAAEDLFLNPTNAVGGSFMFAGDSFRAALK